MSSLFLSHTSIDKPFVEKLAKDLKKLGINVWFDKWEIQVGDSITWKIEEGLRANDYLGIILSPEALESEWVKGEISAAWCRQMGSKKITVLPILYRQCDIPLFLADRKYADFRSDYNQGLSELAAAFGIRRVDTISEDNWRLFMNDRTADWKSYREMEFKNLVTVLVDRAKTYNWSCWVGGTRTPLSITLSAICGNENSRYISIRMVKGAYMASFKPEFNPNNLRASDFTYPIGNSINECEEFVWRAMEDYRAAYGDPEDEAVYSTLKFPRKTELSSLIQQFRQSRDWYQYT